MDNGIYFKTRENCKINQEKIKKEIDDIKTQINELRNENKKKASHDKNEGKC